MKYISKAWNWVKNLCSKIFGGVKKIVTTVFTFGRRAWKWGMQPKYYLERMIAILVATGIGKYFWTKWAIARLGLKHLGSNGLQVMRSINLKFYAGEALSASESTFVTWNFFAALGVAGLRVFGILSVI